MDYLKKSLGQNFLTDKNIVRKILNLIKIKDQNIIEIGPGSGFLTDNILEQKPKTITLIEKDDLLAKKLSKRYYSNRTIKIINSDILKFKIDKLIKKDTIIFGNLPYNISSQIFIKFSRLGSEFFKIKNIVFMFQKEVGEKICGKYSYPNYGRLSIIANYRYDIVEKFLVSANCFFPRPKVDSMVILFKPKKQKKYIIKNVLNLEKVTNIIFSNKRKMINKNIKKILKPSQIIRLKNLNLKNRPSELTPEIYFKIAMEFEKN